MGHLADRVRAALGAGRWEDPAGLWCGCVYVGLPVDSQIPGLGGRDLIAAIDERVDAAAVAGLDSLHVGDKHGTANAFAANIALAGRVSASWRRRLGVLVVSTVWNPVLLAEQLATLAGCVERLDVVVALGGGDQHFASVGYSTKDRLRRFLEGLAVTRALLDGETVSTEVAGLQIANARVAMAGPAKVEWLIAASARRAVERAARVADGWVASAKLTETEAIEALSWYRDAGGTGRTLLRREVFVGAEDRDVARLAAPLLESGHRNYPPGALIAGTTGSVRAALSRIQEAGFGEILARSLLSVNQSQSIDSIHRLAGLRTQL